MDYLWIAGVQFEPRAELEGQGQCYILTYCCGDRSVDDAGELVTIRCTSVGDLTTAKHGVTSTNALVDVVKFFSEHVYQDLQASDGIVHAILHVDAIRFLLTFRNQVCVF